MAKSGIALRDSNYLCYGEKYYYPFIPYHSFDVQAVQEFIDNIDNETGLENISLLVRSFTRDPTIHLDRIKVRATSV